MDVDKIIIYYEGENILPNIRGILSGGKNQKSYNRRENDGTGILA